jgi:hypothetical protein
MKTVTTFPKALLTAGKEIVLKILYTPEMALDILTNHNKLNPRKLPHSRVDAIASSMERGRFPVTGLGLTFATDGHLADGQTRLSAVVKSGVSVPILTVFGAEPSCRQDIDTVSTPRHPADNLVVHLRGLKMSCTRSKAEVFNSGIKQAISLVFGVTRKLSQAEIDALADAYKASGGLAFLDRNFSKSRQKNQIQPVYGAALAAYPVNRDGVQTFISQVDAITRREPGSTLPPSGNPALTFADYLSKGEYVFRRDPSSVRAYKTLVAIERALDGRSMTALNGKVSEEFMTAIREKHTAILGVELLSSILKVPVGVGGSVEA